MNICAIITFLGVIIMAISIIKYDKNLKYMKNQTYETSVFKHPIYIVCNFMLHFFLCGYIIFGFNIIRAKFGFEILLVALIFFFGAIFVFSMVTMQRKMAETIISKIHETIQSLIDSIEAKDEYTKGHSEHVYKITEIFYEHLSEKMKKNIDFEKLKDASMLHDIGKIGIPDNILKKPGALTVEEREIINQHPLNGKNILEKTTYKEISNWVLYHHERVDGKGYYGLEGKDIPIESKIIAIADTFSALFTDRVYRKKFTYEQSMQILKDVSGTQLDKELVEIFCNIDSNSLINIHNINNTNL